MRAMWSHQPAGRPVIGIMRRPASRTCAIAAYAPGVMRPCVDKVSSMSANTPRMARRHVSARLASGASNLSLVKVGGCVAADRLHDSLVNSDRAAAYRSCRGREARVAGLVVIDGLSVLPVPDLHAQAVHIRLALAG